ncbi:MAG TPA: GNAT family N-acetyltransferase, partial [Candidatus Limnocylindrales bacterium]
MTSNLSIVPPSPGTWDALADLFSAGGDPKWCWCQFWRKPGSNWSNTTPDDNRRDLRALVDDESLAPGLVAMQDGKAIGWVGLGPREAFPRLARSRTLPQLPGDAVWSVNCFVVARTARRHGVADALLCAAVDYAEEHGAKIVEGYPVDTSGSRIPSASVYTGTTGM